MRYARNDGVAMTTPRDDIAGLSERLDRTAGRLIDGGVADGDVEAAMLHEAATQLDALSARVKELEADQPFVLTGIGFDYMEGHFTTPVKDPGGLAIRMYQFCPDIVDQGVGTVEKLAAELQNGSLYFWWD